MTFPLEYHDVVNCSVTRSSRSSIPLSLALGMLLLPLLLVSTSPAQISSTGASSSGSGHSASVAPYTGPVAPPTGAFVHNGFTPGSSGVTLSTHTPHSPTGTHSGSNANHHPHRSVNGTAYYPYIYALPVPYAVDVSDADSSDNDDDDDAQYQGGPTIFDRRGSGPDSYIPPLSPGPAHAPDLAAGGAPAEDASVAESAPERPQPPTTLVFKDGHQIEVNNYAIVSQTLYDLTPGHPRKIAVADLDLSATQKQNDDHGVVFQLPPSPQAN
jgi:hypothetical protein